MLGHLLPLHEHAQVCFACKLQYVGKLATCSYCEIKYLTSIFNHKTLATTINGEKGICLWFTAVHTQKTNVPNYKLAPSLKLCILGNNIVTVQHYAEDN